ncbi:MAG: GmrSD restriction endonuclease domain-containing protein [Cellulomonas sp.]
MRLVAASLLLVSVGFTAACQPADVADAQVTSTTRSPTDGTPSGTTAPSAIPSDTPTTPVQPAVAPAEPAASPVAAEAGPAQTAAPTALAAARLLTVKGRAPMTGYDRALFGQAWKDTDRNGCDQRNDVLGRDLTGVAYKTGTHDCVVLTGVLADPYSGTTIAFTRGQATSAAVQIDHVVALADAWQKGAQQWDAATRASFANDLLNLLAVDGPLNDQKGAGDTATWLPPNKAYRCAYVARQVGVKTTYGLWVTPAEQDAMARVLSTCPEQLMPTGSSMVAAAPAPAPVVAAAAPAPAPVVAAPAPAPVVPAPVVQAPAVEVPATVTYANCDAVRAAGAAPIRPGDPGFAKKFDRDGDGIGCE